MSEIEVPGDISTAEFARAAARVTDWIARYLENVEQYPVLAQVAPGDITRQLPSNAPAHGEPLDAMLDDFERIIVPGITHWNHPGFFAYFAISGSAPGILGEMLAAALNVNGMLWRTSPSVTELEQVTLGWLRRMVGLSDEWFGVINDTASISTLLALAAAREARPELRTREKGMAGRADLPVLRVYCSEHAHSSVDRAAITLGFGSENVVHVPSDAEFRMRADALEDLVRRDRAAGMLPLAVTATVGTTSTTSVDPVPAIADICAREQMWLHVDGAYAGVAAICEEHRGILDGVDRADSLVMNPHKWLFTPVDISAFYTRHPDVLRRAFSLVPEYLVTRERDDVVNLMDYGVQLGRRFRAIKLWFVLRAFGVDGLAARLRAHIALAQKFAAWVSAQPEWEIAAPHPFSTVCFRYAPPNTSEHEREVLNTRILDTVNASGRAYLSHTKLNGQYVLRLAIGNIRTEERHVRQAWDLLVSAAMATKTVPQ